MENQGLYYATFRLEKPGFMPVTLQGIYEPGRKITGPEMRIELYQAIHEHVKDHLKTEMFKLRLTGITRLKTDFVYTPGRSAERLSGEVSVTGNTSDAETELQKPE